jgi:ABC-type bacteriocin/lantibiotic exporter with double-glycine peptidase domain
MKKNNKKNKNFKLGFAKFKKVSIENKKILSVVFLIELIMYIAIATLPIIVGKVVDSIINPSEITFLEFTLDAAYFYLIIFSILKFLERYLDILTYNYYLEKIANNVYMQYTKEIFSKLISFPISFFKNQSLGKITYSVNTGADRLSASLKKLPDIFGLPVIILLNSIFLFFISF